jgi:hypothetical protein
VAEVVYGDAEELVGEHAIGSLRRDANKYFRSNKIPLRISTKKKTVSLQLQKS